MITPLVGSILTPSLDGVRLHVEPFFVATTVASPTVTSTRSASALGVTVTRAFASSLATVGAAGVAALPGRVTLAAVLASLFPCFAVALTRVPALAALCATVITPLVGSILTPVVVGDKVHVEPFFVATTVEFPTVTSTRSAPVLGVTVTRAFAVSLTTVGAFGVVSLAGKFAVEAVLASLFPCFAVALTCVPALAALCATVTTPVLESILTPVVVGDKVHVEPFFVATTVEFPTVTSTRSAPVLGVTVTRAFAVSLTTVGAFGVVSLTGKFAVEAVLASLFPCLAVALTCVPALAALCATVTTPLVGSTLTPVFVGDKVHVEPFFVATTVEFPTVTSTRSAPVLGVTVTRAFAVSLTTVGAFGVAVLGALGITTASLISDVASLVVKVFP